MTANAPCPIIFDLDGTLVDSAPDIHGCVNNVMTLFALPPLTLTQVRSFIGGGVDILWTRIVAAQDIDPAKKSAMMTSFMQGYEEAHDLTRMYPGVWEALQKLSDAGHPLGICTNKPLQPALGVLRHFELDTLMRTVVGGDTLPQKKPDPAPLRLAMHQMGVSDDNPRAIFVGDSEYDAECAAAVPIPLMLFTGGYRKSPVSELPHSEAFDHFDELPGLVLAAATA
ncbi:phosphoglycolate phosphatase [Paracoccus sp. R86501]|uniref:phosphoglycolate phosphatase n=1 Tax=Paracoccus sp. R86501 TaxID=3101711 RepID=UPI00366BED42